MRLFAEVGGRRPPRKGCSIRFFFEGQKPPPAADFHGKSGERLFLPGDDAHRLAVGLGPKDKFERDGLRKASAEAAQELAGRGVRHVTFETDAWPLPDAEEAAGIFAESVRLSQYRFSLRSEAPKDKPLESLAIVCRSAAERGRIGSLLHYIEAVADGVDLARDLSNLPGNMGSPAELARRARKLSGGAVRVQVLDRRACERLGMGAFLAVARGSHEPPAFLVFQYNPKSKTQNPKSPTAGRPIVLVGKGVTFDSGGISIKPSDKMEEMKHDKSGAAAVIGIFSAARTLQPRVPLVGLAPLTENLPGGAATRPGDVVRSLSGKTIEVKNTDAEGRLILADALFYAGRFRPEAVIDMATLTGACSIALGDVYAAILSNNDALAQSLQEAGETCGERLWRLPLHDGYDRLIKSSVADVQNIPEGRLAGTIIGGMFLKKFLADEHVPWAHLDIAATAWDTRGRDGRPPGATGIGVRLFYEFLRARGDLPKM